MIRFFATFRMAAYKRELARGYDFASSALLSGTATASELHALSYLSVDTFDVGIRTALADWERLQFSYRGGVK